MRLSLLLLATAFLASCATKPAPHFRPAPAFPAEALITQRAVLTIFGGRQFTLNGYLAISSTNGQRLVVTENLGNVLADVLVKPNQQVYVMKSSPVLKPEWIKRHVAADLKCVTGLGAATDCRGEQIGPDRLLLARRWYRLDLQTVAVKPGAQPDTLFDATKAER